MDALEAHLAEKARARRTRNSFVRAKAKAFRNAQALYPFPEGWESWEYVDWVRARHVVHHYRNRKVCSGMWCGCGNPRRYRGITHPTSQEQHAELALAEQCAEYRECGTE